MTFVVALVACLAIGVAVGVAVGALANCLAARYMRARQRATVARALAPYDGAVFPPFRKGCDGFDPPPAGTPAPVAPQTMVEPPPRVDPMYGGAPEVPLLHPEEAWPDFPVRDGAHQGDLSRALCELVRHYDDEPTVACDKPATRTLRGDFKQIRPIDARFCEEHAKLLETERAAIDTAERSVVRNERTVPRWRYCCASDGMRLLCQYLDRSPDPCEAFATDLGILPYCPTHRVEALAEVVWVPSPWSVVK